MASLIDPTTPADGLAPAKADLRNNLQAAKQEIEALQTGKADLTHSHGLIDVAGAGALAAKNVVASPDIADGAVTATKIAVNAVGAAQLQDGIAINMADAVLRRAELKDYAETSPTLAIAAGAATVDLESGNVVEITLTEDLTALTLANPPAPGRAGSLTLIMRQDATGGRSVAWPAAVRWPGGTAPVISTAPDAVDVYALFTRDGGTTWYGCLAGQEFA